MNELRLVIDEALQKEILRKDCVWKLAYRSAMVWLGRLVAAGTDPLGDPAMLENCKNSSHPNDMEKWLCPYHHAGMVEELFRSTQCVEVSLVLQSGLELRVVGNLYGERHALVFYFHTDGTLMGGGDIRV